MNNTIIMGGKEVEVLFGVVSQAPFSGRHQNTRTFEVSFGGVKIDLSVDAGRRIGGNGPTVSFEKKVLRKSPQRGDHVCFDKSGAMWGYRRFYDRAFASVNGISTEEENEDQARERLWAETPPEQVALFASGRNTGVSHRNKFPAASHRRR